MNRIFPIILPLLLVVTGAQAAGTSQCDDAALDQSHMTQCAEDHYAAADTALNKAYRDLMNALQEDSRKTKLKAAQRAWLTFRDAQCTYRSSEMEGGSAEPMLFAGCAASETEARTKALVADMKCLTKNEC